MNELVSREQLEKCHNCDLDACKKAIFALDKYISVLKGLIERIILSKLRGKEEMGFQILEELDSDEKEDICRDFLYNYLLSNLEIIKRYDPNHRTKAKFTTWITGIFINWLPRILIRKLREIKMDEKNLEEIEERLSPEKKSKREQELEKKFTRAKTKPPKGLIGYLTEENKIITEMTCREIRKEIEKLPPLKRIVFKLWLWPEFNILEDRREVLTIMKLTKKRIDEITDELVLMDAKIEWQIIKYLKEGKAVPESARRPCYEQIAEFLGINRNYVDQIIHRVRKEIEKKFKNIKRRENVS